MAERPRNKTVVTAVSRISDKAVRKPACLVVIYGPDLARKYDLERASVVIGRSSKSDVHIDQESVSRNHAKIINTGQANILRDLGSTNGTYVNDELVDEYVLQDGDLVKIGRTIFKYLGGNNIENAYHEEIYRLTTIDGLTQVYNKRYFLEVLGREMSRAHRYRRDLSLILFDIDHFKKINDTHGHLAGDYVLKRLAQVIKAKIRREDIISRYGGEEFAIVLPEISGENAMVTAEKIRKIVERTSFKFEDSKISVTVSIGVRSLTSGARDPMEFIRQADENLYEAKTRGRNQVCG
ncbi:MAG: GGDEF domain-containing protein [Deltaproteobacteria bacterium]|nr:GGDEF domain-containing protein [Deltaproteobacteria bacterium]